MAFDRTRLIVSHGQPAYIFLLLFATVQFQSQQFSSSKDICQKQTTNRWETRSNRSFARFNALTIVLPKQTCSNETPFSFDGKSSVRDFRTARNAGIDEEYADGNVVC